MKFVLLDESTPASQGAQYGGPIAPATLAAMAQALTVYLNRDVASYWGGNHAVREGSGPSDVQPSEVVCALVDSLPDAPGAVAYHDVAGQEVPVVFLARTQCNSIGSGPDSVSNGMSHELAETVGDAYVNAWRDGGDGKEYAQELCDAVQETGYAIAVDGESFSVSNFVLPAFFAPGAPGPYDYLGTIGQGAVSAPLQTAAGGYQLVRTGGTGETQVTGEIAPRRRAKKRHPTSRTYRRGARL